ncbi:hypothetical protein GCM10023213_07470 [Prosthecobacter algae]|uniref:Uncharacterized protein n=1 Tax=Prosthecobacter algae TaxID=1144682 RepID=A0ABP9NVB4_9BACT
MPTPEDKLQSIQDQLNSKIHWDANEIEVEEWLEEKHGISGEAAEAMLMTAKRKRRAAIRERALYQMIFAVIGMSIPGSYLTMQWMTGRISLFITPLSAILFLLAFSFFLRGLSRFLSGQTDASIDS